MRRTRVPLLGFVLGIAGGVLLIRAALDFRPSVEDVLLSLLPLALGLLAVSGAFQMYIRRYWEGAALCLAAGISALLIGGLLVEGLVTVLAGIVALAAMHKKHS